LNSSETRCDLSWELADSDLCPGTDDPHPLCGVTVYGTTIYTFQHNNYRWDSAYNDLKHNYDNNYYNSEYHGGKILTPEENNYHTRRSFRARFSPAVFSDHPVWNGFVLPEFQVGIFGLFLKKKSWEITPSLLVRYI